MDAFTIDTPVDATVTDYPAYETLREQVANLTNHITTLQSNYDSMKNNWEFQRDRAFRQADQIKQFTYALKDHVASEEIDLDVAQMYADIFDVVLTKKYDVSVTVTFSGTAEVPLGMDEDSITSNVSFSFDEGWSDGVEWDMTEDNVDWDIQEAY